VSVSSMNNSKLAAVLGIGSAMVGGLWWWWMRQLTKPKVTPVVQYVSSSSPVVVVDYQDVLNPNCDLSASIEAAFGYEGLGIITVRNVPQLSERRRKLLPLAHKFATLPDAVKCKYEHPQSTFSFGWSHGKEKFNGKPDIAKGSYYNNPIFNDPFNSDPKVIREQPSFASPNIWPTEELPELEPAFMNLGQLIHRVGCSLAVHCDQYVKARKPSYTAGRLERCIWPGKACKARLLHYFPVGEYPENSNQDSQDFSSWCGWHNDHGSLTGLVAGMYIDKDGKEVPCPDPKAGLYIRSRQGTTLRASWPADCLAFQMGETQQIHSGGVLLATPHCVRAAMNRDSVGVSRETYAVFMEPLWDEQMDVPAGTSPEDVRRGTTKLLIPKGVPTLDKRWEPNISFGEFSARSLAEYY